MTRPLIRTWIQGSCAAPEIRMMLIKNKDFQFRPANSLQVADLVVYTGGSDVSPSLYQEGQLTVTSVDPAQDRADVETFGIARRMKKFQLGICRGAQFLNVMNGGKLWQHIDNHGGQDHVVQDKLSNKTFVVNSYHHQQCQLHPSAVLLAHAEVSTEKLSFGKEWRKNLGNSIDVEAYWYPESSCLGVQWHPEWDDTEGTELMFEYFRRYYPEKRAA